MSSEQSRLLSSRLSWLSISSTAQCKCGCLVLGHKQVCAGKLSIGNSLFQLYFCILQYSFCHCYCAFFFWGEKTLKYFLLCFGFWFLILVWFGFCLVGFLMVGWGFLLVFVVI